MQTALLANSIQLRSYMLLVRSTALGAIVDYTANASFEREVGGIFVGLRRAGTVEITKATFPGRKDVSQYHSFTRKDWTHQGTATWEWLCSGFKLDWVGEWHSHPEPSPSPSKTDLATWEKQVKRRNVSMAYIIVGAANLWVGVWPVNGSNPKRLGILEETSDTILFN
jgi:integrative and conjugative element protein (TIGR02256 family)